MLTNDPKDINALIKKSTFDFEKLPQTRPLATFNGTPYLHRGTLSLITASHPGPVGDFLSRVVASTCNSSTPGMEMTPCDMMMIDAVNTRAKLAKWHEETTSKWRYTHFIDLIHLLGCDCDVVLDAVEYAVGNRTHKFFIVNDMSALIKGSSYGETKRVLRRLATIADRYMVHIMLVGAPGFKLSTKRPSCVAALYLQHCSTVITLDHDLEKASYTVDVHLTDSMTSLPQVIFMMGIAAPISAAAPSKPIISTTSATDGKCATVSPLLTADTPYGKVSTPQIA